MADGAASRGDVHGHGVHYPTDIAAGAVLGVGCGASVLLARSFFAG